MLPEISNSYLEFDNNSSDEFFNMRRSKLDQHAPRKRKYPRGNHMPFMNETFSKEIMKRTKIRNKFLKELMKAENDTHHNEIIAFHC